MTQRILILAAAAVLAIAACGGDSDSGTDTSAAAPADDAAATTSAGTESMDGVHAFESDLGTILAGPDGFTLYGFTADTDGESTCYDACADLWPPVPADTPIASSLDAGMFGSAPRTDGTEQLTVSGQPLYTYTPDAAPGDTTGQGVNDVWFVVGTDGAMIGAPEATGTSSDEDEGVLDYGY